MIGLGVLLEDESDRGYALVELVPSGRQAEARVLQIGAAAGQGVYVALPKGAEVVVLVPDDGTLATSAVAIGGFSSRANPRPSAGDGAVVLHPDGVELRHDDASPARRLVDERLLSDLAAWMVAFDVFMSSTAAAAAAPAIATAAGTFQAAAPPITSALQTKAHATNHRGT